jgi:hypothetical protein
MTPTAIAQIDRAAVNRANALHSTGPCTAEGKQTSSRNPIRHGLTARTAVLPAEDPAASLCKLNKKRGIPFDPAENGFVFSKSEIDAFAQQQMRLNEARRLEHVLLDPTRPPIRETF